VVGFFGEVFLGLVRGLEVFWRFLMDDCFNVRNIQGEIISFD